MQNLTRLEMIVIEDANHMTIKNENINLFSIFSLNLKSFFVHLPLLQKIIACLNIHPRVK